jgi:pilus assembly protein CpaE
VSSLPLTIQIVLEDGIDPEPIEQALPPGTHARTQRLLEVGPNALASGAAHDVLIVGAAGHSKGVLGLVEAASRQRPDRPIVVLHTGSPNGFMEQVFAAGADDLITLPLPHAQLAFALEKAMARRRGATPANGSATMISVLGPKGGTGKTLTTCNLATALAAGGARPVVIDLDLQFGDVGLALGLRPERTIYDLAVAGGSLDGDKVDAFLAETETGVRALLAPLRPDQASAIDISFLRAVFELLRARYDFVIVDTPPAFTAEVIAAVDASSQLCVVGMLDALSLKDTKVGLETLAQMGYDPAAVTLVLNRADTNVGIARADVERLLGRKPDVLVPSDRAIPRAITDGRTITEAEPRSGAAKAFRSLSEHYVRVAAVAAGEAPAEANGRRRGLLRKGGN